MIFFVNLECPQVPFGPARSIALYHGVLLS